VGLEADCSHRNTAKDENVQGQRVHLLYFAFHMLLHKLTGNFMELMSCACKTSLQVIVREGMRHVLPLATLVEWIITSVDPNKPPAPRPYIPKRLRRWPRAPDRPCTTDKRNFLQSTYVAWQLTTSAYSQSAWAHSIDRAWKAFWRTSPRKPTRTSKNLRATTAFPVQSDVYIRI
jgi:hypothetical protein